MNKNIISLILLFVSLALCSFGQTISTANQNAPLPVSTMPIVKVLTVATPTITVGATATKVTGIPAGAKAITILAAGGVINYGGSTVSTGLTFPSIASGSWKEFVLTPLSNDPRLYLCAQSAGATYTAYLRFAY